MQVEKLDKLIQNKIIEKDQWYSIAVGVTTSGESERVQSSGNQQKMANAVEKYVDLEKEIDAEIDRLIDLKKDVINVIESLNSAEYDVLHKRYIQSLPFAEIAADRKISYSQATTIHGRALESVQAILDGRNGAGNEK